MEAYNESKFYSVFAKSKSWLTATLGLIVTLLGILIIFFIASLEGTKEIKASNSDNAKIMNIWREENDAGVYPQEKAEIIEYNGKEYYFVVDEYYESADADVKVIKEWHFAYDGGFDYVYKDYKFYVLTVLVYFISMFVSMINYTSSSKSAMELPVFGKTLQHYQGKKQQAEQYTQYIPMFCNYKNKQTYETAVRDIVEEAGLNYNLYIKKSIDLNNIEKWQKKKLKDISKIKIKKLHTSDLLQEQGYSSTKISLLPISQREHQKAFLISGGIQKLITSALSGLVVSFGVVLGNWWLGAIYGFVVLLSAVVAIVVSTDFVTSGLRNRFIGKADLLNEFYNMKDTFIREEREMLKKQDINGEKDLKENDGVV